jgi:hypothetical protein
MPTGKGLTPEEKQAVVDCYLKYTDCGSDKIAYGHIQNICLQAIPGRVLVKSTVDRVLAAYRAGKAANPLFTFEKSHHRGYNLKQTPEAKAAYRDILHDDKETPAYPTAMNVLEEKGFPMSRASVFRLQRDVAKPHHEHLKPKKSILHEIQRMKFVIDEVDSDSKLFHKFTDQVHSDEKRFAIMKDGSLYHWPKGEPLPDDDECTHKSYIGWVMILIVVAMPRSFIHNSEHITFDGRIGTYAIIKDSFWIRGEQFPRTAPKSTKRGENAACYCELLEKFVFPDIKRVMYWQKHLQTWYQHDGASCHRAFKKFDCQAVYDRISPFGAGSITVHRQPAQSPEFMILDLAINKAIETRVLHIKPSATTISDIIQRVSDVFFDEHGVENGLKWETLAVPWGVLAEVFRMVLKYKGKSFRHPHSHVRQRMHCDEAFVDRHVNMEDFNACDKIVNEYYGLHPDDINVDAEPDLLPELGEEAEDPV